MREVSCAAQHEGWGRAWNTCDYACTWCARKMDSHVRCHCCSKCRCFWHQDCAKAEEAGRLAAELRAARAERERAAAARAGCECKVCAGASRAAGLGAAPGCGGTGVDGKAWRRWKAAQLEAEARARAPTGRRHRSARARCAATSAQRSTQVNWGWSEQYEEARRQQREEFAAAARQQAEQRAEALEAGRVHLCPGCGGSGRTLERRGLLQLRKRCRECGGAGVLTPSLQLQVSFSDTLAGGVHVTAHDASFLAASFELPRDQAAIASIRHLLAKSFDVRGVDVAMVSPDGSVLKDGDSVDSLELQQWVILEDADSTGSLELQQWAVVEDQD